VSSREPAEASAARAAGWSVWRQDDHGSRFEVARDLPLAEARARAAKLEAGGHKQTCWVEPTERAGRG
jgi:hypothetical protein